MSARKLFLIAGLTVAIAAFAWGFNQAAAQSGGPRQRQLAPDSVVTDAGGHTHYVMPMRRITPEQRKAAAERRKAMMDAVAAQKKQGTPAAKGEGAK